jgi:phosphoglycerate dehydrogenase-like enzyme
VADHPLYELPNTICTPHIASYTSACVVLMQIQACEQIALALTGQRPNHLVNPDVWQR